MKFNQLGFSIAATLLLMVAIVSCDDDSTMELGERGGFAQAIVQDQQDADERCVGFSLDRMFEYEHMVEVGEGVQLHVKEKFTIRSLISWPHKSILMLPGTLATNDMYDPDVEGDEEGSFNALERAAKHGYFAYAMSYEGYGQSSKPAHGGIVTAERILEQTGELVDMIQSRTLAPKVDLLGTSLGSSVATALGGINSPICRHRIGKIIMTAHIYKSVTPMFDAILNDPALQQMFNNAPSGYIVTGPEMYGAVIAASEPAAAAWAFENFPGQYSTGPTIEGFSLPVFEGDEGRAPVLQVWGDHDLATPYEDVEQFANEYGGCAGAVTIPGGGHSPTFEPTRDLFWENVFSFLSAEDGCDYLDGLN